MADSDKDILIVPNTGQAANPTITFSSGATGGDPITLSVTDDGTTSSLSLDASSGNLLFIENGGSVGIGTNSPAEKFQIEGGNIAHYSNAVTASLTTGRNANENIVLATTDGAGSLTYNQDETDGTNHSFNFIIDAPGTNANKFTFNKPLSIQGEYFSSTEESSWGFRASTSGTSNDSGLWFSGTTARLLLRDSSGTIKTMLAANGTNSQNVINGNTIWHAGNDGPDSGLNADTVDGLQASQFLRSDATSITSGNLTVEGYFATNVIRDRTGQQLIILAGEATEDASQTAEKLYVNAEGGLEVAASNDNWATGYAGTRKTLIDYNGITYNGNTVWHAGNDGPGTGLNADTVDGLHASSFLRSDAGDTASQRIVFSANDTNSWDTIATASGSQGAFEVFNNGSGTDAFMTFHVGGDYACYFGLDGGINDIAVGGWSMGANSYRIWHQGNDGSGSGLDADTVDGLQASQFLRSDADDTMSGNLTVTGDVSVRSDAIELFSKGIYFEAEKHAITFNDGRGNFNIRVGNSITELSTESGYAFHDEWSQASGWRQFNVSSASLGLGDPVTWRTQLQYDSSSVYLRYEGSTRLSTTDAGVSVIGDVTATTFNGALSGNASTASKWASGITISLTGAVTGSVSIDGSEPVSIVTTATSDPTLTLNGDVSGTATFTNLGNATLTATVANDSHTHDGRYYTEAEIDTFFNRGYINKVGPKTGLAAGWYTIATNTGNRALGEFQIWDTAGSDHQSVLFNASHHYGTDSSNDITVLANSRFSGTNFRYIRIKEAGTYDGAALQVYIDAAGSVVNAAIVGGNAQEFGWVLKDWIADATDPGDVDNWTSFTEAAIVDLDLIINGGILTTGKIFANSTQEVAREAGTDFTGTYPAYFRVDSGTLYSNPDVTYNGTNNILALPKVNATTSVTTPLVIGSGTQSRDKLRVWSSGSYTIGMKSGYTYGHLNNDYAMSFQMNNDADRGFWWGDDAHTDAQGAMSLTTDGKLTVATSLSVGQGQGIVAPSGKSLYVAGNAEITNTLQIPSDTGTIIFRKDNKKGFIPLLAQYYANLNPATGAIKIAFPVAGTDDMINGWVDIFDYRTNESVSIFIAGYLYQSSGNTWVHETAINFTSNSSKDYTVRFGTDGTKNCIWIGELTSTWNYPQITLRDWSVGFTANTDNYATGTTISFVTSFDTVEETLAGNLPAAQFLGGLPLAGASSVGSSIFNNKGQLHNTYTNFNTAMEPGPNYIQAGTNSPTGNGSHQWYGIMFGLGSQYGTTTGEAANYASQMYYPRATQNSNSYLYFRDLENGSWGSWRKVQAGNADKWTTARTITLGGDLSGSVLLDGSDDVTLTANVGNAETVDGLNASSFVRSDANDAKTGYLYMGANLYLGNMGTATSTTNYSSWPIIFRGSGWDTNNSTARNVEFYLRAEPESSVYPNVNLVLYEEAASYNHKKVEFHGLGSGSAYQDSRSATFYGDVSIVANTDSAGGSLTVANTISITGATGENALSISGTSPTISLHDTNNDSFYIHANSNNFYVLADRNGSGAYGTWETPHPLQLEAATNKGFCFGQEILTGNVTGSLFANVIEADVITADMIQSNSIVSTLITADTISANNITTGTLDANDVTIANLNVNNLTGDVSEHYNSFFANPSNKRFSFSTGSTPSTAAPFSVPAPSGGVEKRLYINGWIGVETSTNDIRVRAFVEQKGFTVASINLGQLISTSPDEPEDGIRQLVYTGDLLSSKTFAGGYINGFSTYSSTSNTEVWGYAYDSDTNRTTVWVDDNGSFSPTTSNDPHYWHAGPQSASTWVRVGVTSAIGDYSTSTIDPGIVVPINFVLPAQTTTGQLRVGVERFPTDTSAGTIEIVGWNCNFGWLR